MNRHTIDQRLLNERTKINDLDERTSRTPRNLNETKRSGRTNKKIEHWISFKDLIEKALIFSGAENFDDKICWEDFEAPECTKIQDIQNFRITTNIFCL
ncbi:unnamed protein product [Rhizophagus irregularis]|uniref:Uncharacterized protein n=1 Tax=Rhizophagus irregularis TaxID=588596 RepID=A0A915YUE3_9GLOM|nr:unnamed protein product [Rhizophagus irregularis]